VKIIALLSSYDEDPAWLAAAIASTAKIGADHLVAVDGAYSIFPDAKPASGHEQHAAIVETTLALGMGLTLHVPQQPFVGNEVEKRSLMFALAEQVAEPNIDWYMVIDADEVIRKAPDDLRQRLETTTFDAARVEFENREPPRTKKQQAMNWEPITRVDIPIFFRAIPNLRVVGNHFTYEVVGTGRKLWGMGDSKTSGLVTDFEDLTDLKIDHKTAFREANRKQRSKDYYARRDRERVERHICIRCDADAKAVVIADPEIQPSGHVAANQVGVCEKHQSEVEAASLRTMRKLGIPDDYFRKSKPVGVA
jgi:hypothetical protein